MGECGTPPPEQQLGFGRQQGTACHDWRAQHKELTACTVLLTAQSVLLTMTMPRAHMSLFSLYGLSSHSSGE